jgi:hypothetical protein
MLAGSGRGTSRITWCEASHRQAEPLFRLLTTVQVHVHPLCDPRGRVAHHHRQVLKRDAPRVSTTCEAVAQLVERDLGGKLERHPDRLPRSALHVPMGQPAAAAVPGTSAPHRGEYGVAVLREPRAEPVPLQVADELGGERDAADAVSCLDGAELARLRPLPDDVPDACVELDV